MPNASISACMVSNSAFSRAYSSLRTFDAIWGAIARGTARKRVTGRPSARIQGRCLRSAHCPHCVFSPFFSRGDIDRRAFQRAPPPSATGVREAPPQVNQHATGLTPLPKHRPTGHAKHITAQQEPGQPGSRSSTPGRRRADRRSAERRRPRQRSRCSDGCQQPAPCGPRIRGRNCHLRRALITSVTSIRLLYYNMFAFRRRLYVLLA